MKALKERMKNFNLTITTKTEDISGAGPDSPLKKSKSPAKARSKSSRKVITKVSDSELASMYEIKGQVMESTHSGMQVLFGKRLSDGLEVVVKTRDKATSFKGGWEEREWRDTTVAQLNMPKIDSMCEYFAVYETWEKYYVIMERAMGMDLFEQLQQEHMKQEEARHILHQMLTALHSMHSLGRIHKDLKLENVVVDMRSPTMRRCSSNGSMTSIEAKLIDFDTVQDWEPTSPKAKDVLGTDGYIAPEAYAGEYSPASDVYCVGVIMYKLLTGRFPSRADIFDDLPGENWVGSPAMKRIQERLRKQKIDFKRPPLDKCPHAQDLLRRMLDFDPNERPTAEEALAHKWFSFTGDGKASSAASKSTSASSSLRSPVHAQSASGSAACSPTNGKSNSLSPKVEPKMSLPGELEDPPEPPAKPDEPEKAEMAPKTEKAEKAEAEKEKDK